MSESLFVVGLVCFFAGAFVGFFACSILVMSKGTVESDQINRDRKRYADWLDEAAEEIGIWGLHAPEIVIKKRELVETIKKFKDRANLIRPFVQPKD